MTLEEARAIGFISNGKQYYVATMTEKQLLVMKDYIVEMPKVAEACRIELEARKNEKR